jgi:predicted secreted Zn-dependent protease
MTHESVQSMVLPADTARVVMTINKDPELEKLREQKALEEAGRKAQEERRRQAERDRFEASRVTTGGG